MEPVFFASQEQFRKWLEDNHKAEKELLVGFYKIETGIPSITWPQSVDQALCFGWIDGVRKSINKNSYSIRFTPRKPTSTWSAINIKKVEDLVSQGLMQPAGWASFEKRSEKKSRIYSYEKDPVKLADALEEKFKANKKAWNFFHSQAPSYRKTAIHWVMSAKQEKTVRSRFDTLISDSEAGKRLGHLSYNGKNK